MGLRANSRTGYACAFQKLKATMPPQAWAALMEQMRPIGYDTDERPIFESQGATLARGFKEWMREDFGHEPIVEPSHQSIMNHRRGDCVRCGAL